MIKNKNPNTQPSHNEMKEVENLYKTNQLDLLEIKLRKLIEIHPQTSILFNILGVILQKKRLFEDAINSFNKAINIQPNFDQAYNNLGSEVIVIDKDEILSNKEPELKEIIVSKLSNEGIKFYENVQIEEISCTKKK